MQSRKDIAKSIAEKPNEYKICEGCDSIVVTSTQICPNCHAYRYNTKETDVIQQAELLGSRDQTSVTADDLIE